MLYVSTGEKGCDRESLNSSRVAMLGVKEREYVQGIVLDLTGEGDHGKMWWSECAMRKRVPMMQAGLHKWSEYLPLSVVVELQYDVEWPGMARTLATMCGREVRG